MAEWQLLADITLEEESASVEAIFDKGYEELDILVLNVGTSSNTNTNKNALTTPNNIVSSKLFIGSLALASGVTRVLHVKCRRYPYWQGDWDVLNQSALNAGGNSTTHGSFVMTDKQEAFTKIGIVYQISFFGVGSRMIVYGR